jgi:LDH2 family malate/lactate/ureidoglycolate dehydrogenase
MPRVDAAILRTNVADMFSAAGMDREKAEVVAEVLVEADLIGHVTHGVGLVPWYLDALASGEMIGSGEPTVVTDRGACLTWNGNGLPGPWLVTRALATACGRVAEFGVVTVAISRAHHTGALAAYLRKVTERGLVAHISCSTASTMRMAPFGGTAPMVTPNPQAYGFPTDGDPVLIDISSSITTTTHTRQLAKRGERFPDAWALTAAGEPTDDPQEVTMRGGTLMPLGGALKGHKGFSLALAIEALGQGLSGYGRADAPKGIVLSVFVQVMDPAAFAGRDAFVRQTSHLTGACRSNPPAPGVARVRVPGDAAAASRRKALEMGVPLDTAIEEELRRRSAGLRVAWNG